MSYSSLARRRLLVEGGRRGVGGAFTTSCTISMSGEGDLEFGKLFTGKELIGTKGCGEVGRDPTGLDSPLDSVTVAGETRGVERLKEGEARAERTPPAFGMPACRM